LLMRRACMLLCEAFQALNAVNAAALFLHIALGRCNSTPLSWSVSACMIAAACKGRCHSSGCWGMGRGCTRLLCSCGPM
jgi:hypothetical protein